MRTLQVGKLHQHAGPCPSRHASRHPPAPAASSAQSANGVAPNGITVSPATACFPSGVTKNAVGCTFAFGRLVRHKHHHLAHIRRHASSGSPRPARCGSSHTPTATSETHSPYPPSAHAAVKYFGFAGGNGSAFGVCPIFCNCSGAAGFCAAAAGAWSRLRRSSAPVCAPANAVTLRAAANPANIQFEIFKESILRRRLSARSTSYYT